MFYRIGRFTVKHRRAIPLVIVAGIMLLYVVFGLRLDARLSQEGWEDPHASSTRAAATELAVFGRDNSGDVILLFRAEQGVDNPEVNSAARRHLTDLKDAHPDRIDSVTSYFDTRNPNLVNDDGTLAFAAIGLKGDGEQTLKDFRAIEQWLVPDTLPDGMSVEVAGATAVADALDDGMARDISRAELIALPLVAVLLLVVFGSVVAAAMPLVVGVLAILGALGVLSVLASFLQVNVFAHAIVTLLGLGLAIDYGLLMVSRFREELDARRPVGRAVANTVATAGKTVVFSAGMVIVALSGLLLFPQAFLKSVAYGAIAAVGLAAALSVTLLPALFALLGPRIDTWSVRRTSRRARAIEDTWWYRVPAWAMTRAKLVTVGIVGALLLLTLPTGAISFGGINETYLPPSHATRQAQDAFNEAFPEFRTDPIKLVVSDATNEQLVDVVLQSRAVEGLTSPMTAGATVDGTTVLYAGIAERADYGYVVDQLRAITAPDGVTLEIGGTPAMEVESLEALFARLPWMLLYLTVVTFLLMTAVFGSLIQPAKAIIMTVLGLGATLGVLTALFVQGVGASLLGFTPGPLMSPVLVLIIAIIYGLSTDYEVFLVSRMVEARERGHDTNEAIRLGTAHTGTIITAAALIMMVVAGAFAFSDIVMMKYIAAGMIVALALDATIIRMLLVPSVMSLLKEDNWWAPAPVKRLYYRLGHGPAWAAAPGARGDREVRPGDDNIDDAIVLPANEAARGGVATDSDEDLVPFSELIHRLEHRNEG
ncbi:MMPL family transporter [Corynebacterium uterequi]|uniref:Putative RND superfamily drug exporter n=1 Tax=Corynebacterium uterequi TaxID=1072256 RepID=A0A0G3HFE8_9CORY|nr:MMPL family transporter [Corynebacterium uterequi]AKK12039.1 putative RND superfamily drug exporter [Corynebacterium uterequi]